MNELFGLSMNYVMIALIILLAIALGSVGWVLLRSRVMFLLGVRNIPRRRAQTILIVIGLMLSTLIISTAFSIGDTVDYSITNEAYSRLHSIDLIVQAAAGEEDNGPFANTSLVSARPIPASTALRWAEQIRQLDGVDGAVRVIRAPVPVRDERSGQTEPVVVLVGVDPNQMQGFEDDIESADGRRLSLADLAPDEIYANESAAEKLDIARGDTLQIFVQNTPHAYVVRDIVKDRVLSGALVSVERGLLMPLASAQSLLGRPDEVDLIAVSLDGGVHNDLHAGEAIKRQINGEDADGNRTGAGIVPAGFAADTTKKDVVDSASEAASFLTTFFVILGLFAIAAGMMLIFLIFVMLAAERRTEMGMVRAVGTKRLHLVQTFLSEGMGYNVAAAAVGCALGVTVAIGMVRIMAALFADFGLNIVFHVTPRSLIISYSLGVVLTFLTVTFSSWRISNLNIVAAIRDVPESPPPLERPSVRSLGGIARYAVWLLFKPTSWRRWFASLGIGAAGIVIGLVSVGFYVAAVLIYGSSPATSVLAVLLFIAGVLLSGVALVVAGIGFLRVVQLGAFAMLLSVPLILGGLGTESAALFGMGVSLLIGGFALTAIQVGAHRRAVSTAAGLAVLAFWLLFVGGTIFSDLSGDIEMFFISGVAMILAATFVLVYNADLLLGLLLRAGGASSTLIPSIRTAVAYPLANKFRTGMTIAMISLVMFALVVMSTMNSNFNRILSGDEARGGYDLIVQESPSNHIGDLKAVLAAAGGDGGAAAQQVDAQAEVQVANGRVSEVRNAPRPGDDPTKVDWSKYTVAAPTDSFIDTNAVSLQGRAEGYATDADVWRALATRPDLAVVDDNAVSGGGFGGGSFQLEGVKQGQATFKPLPIQVRDASAPDKVKDVRVIGIISPKASALFGRLYLSQTTFAELFPRPDASVYYVRLQPGADATAAARAIERTLSARGVQADSLRKLISDFQAQSRGFSYLIQGFMGIGLFVGIAAVGVIAFRTVVERRQQIGMLRAIGYTRRAVAISFILESSFVALLGVLSGVVLGLLLTWELLGSEEFANAGITGFYVPWLEIIGIAAFAFLASLVMTIIPSRQASSIPIAEALRYE